MPHLQEKLDLFSEVTLVLNKPLFYKNENLSSGHISQLAFKAGRISF